MQKPEPLTSRGRAIACGGGPVIFGILNVTPDSFSDGGLYASADGAVAAAARMANERADVIDVGGESTRPGSKPVPADEQIRRTVDVIRALSERFGPGGPAISIDTRSAKVAAAALDVGATIINDISAMRDDTAMAALVAERGAGVVLMHMQGTPATMQQNPTYDDVVEEIKAFLVERMDAAVSAGISRERVIVDPGIGFGKTTAHNLKILESVDVFRSLGCPVMVGPSRKRFIGDVLDIGDPQARVMGTAAAVAACVLAGIECLRVHDVAACRQVADVCAAIRRGSNE
jgi:dihydropteroate synthase